MITARSNESYLTNGTNNELGFGVYPSYPGSPDDLVSTSLNRMQDPAAEWWQESRHQLLNSCEVN